MPEASNDALGGPGISEPAGLRPKRDVPDGLRCENLAGGEIRFHPEGPVQVPSALVATAAWYTEHYERGSGERAERLGSQLAALGLRDRTVVVLTFGASFAPLFVNWVRSCDRAGIDCRRRTLVFPTDPQAAAIVEREGYQGHFEVGSPILEGMEASGHYGDAAFVRYMFYQGAIVKTVLDLGYDVLFQDVDVVWLRDPLAYLLDDARERQDVEFMYDGVNPRFQPMYANSGFVYLRNTQCTRHFWNLVYKNYDKVLYYRSQQEPLNMILACLYHRGLRANILPESLFANGHLFHLDRGEVPKSAYVAHCSWTRNLAHKIEKFRAHDLWFVADAAGT